MLIQTLLMSQHQTLTVDGDIYATCWLYRDRERSYRYDQLSGTDLDHEQLTFECPRNIAHMYAHACHVHWQGMLREGGMDSIDLNS